MIAPLVLLFWQGLVEQADEAFRAGEVDRAVVLASKAIAQQPGAVHAHMILGIAAARRQQWEAANRHFSAVVRLAPEDPNGYFYLGQARLYQKQWEPALREFAKAAERGFPDEERLHVETAFAENEAGRPQLALERLGLIASPVTAHFHAVRAFAHARLNQFPEALDAMAKARDLEPANARHSAFLISTLIATDQMQAALREAIGAQAHFPDDAGIQFLFALASYYVPESPLSGLALRNLNEIEPGGPRVLMARGLLHRKRGATAQALAAFQQAAKLGLPDSHLLLAILHKENGDAAAAEREFREAERVNPHNGQLLLELGKLALARGDLPGARSRLESAVAFLPANSSAHYQLSLAYARLGKKEEAERHRNVSRELDRKQAELQDKPRSTLP